MASWKGLFFDQQFGLQDGTGRIHSVSVMVRTRGALTIYARIGRLQATAALRMRGLIWWPWCRTCCGGKQIELNAKVNDLTNFCASYKTDRRRTTGQN